MNGKKAGKYSLPIIMNKIVDTIPKEEEENGFWYR